MVYYFLTALSAWARTGVGRRSGRRDLAWAGVFLAYGAADEWLQSFVGRTMSLGDFIADALGVALATVVRIALARKRWNIGTPVQP